MDWTADKVAKGLQLPLKKRLAVAVEMLQSAIVKKINRPTTKGRGPKGGRLVTNRSKKGEYPKVDTGLLKNSIISGVEEDAAGNPIGWVGLTLAYGVILETRMERLLLVATFMEKSQAIRDILTKPIGSRKKP